MGSRVKVSLKEKGKKELVSMEEDIEDDEEIMGYGDDDKKKKVVSRRGSSGGGGGGGGVGIGGGGGGVALPCCQAEKCSADLTDAKRYYRRHKVCEHHSKAPVVIVGGVRQRFCQQCSSSICRFHELSEFDEAKRSCRRRLAGHNERRRKNSSEFQGEGSSNKVADPLKDNHCRQVNQNGRIPLSLSGNSKHFQIR
ncbi:hypothetical protein AQUCO_03300055v1 [Aquilegia coerulea]|uniref:SBP-type domain-containing protein n=1 Tax=Aquilegia coerulea TaxID=218851 RepID=A0A2G5CZB7_AQUCA|nr:hypothetical protein AQUCO_03300055v1 [Aquilegia coerulea]